MSAAPYNIEPNILSKWQVRPNDVSAKHEIGLIDYKAAQVVLIPISSAERDGARLVAKKPVGVKVVTSDDGTAAENEALQIFAYGETADEALDDFRSQLFELYSHYSRLSDADVIGQASVLRKLFADNFEISPTR